MIWDSRRSILQRLFIYITTLICKIWELLQGRNQFVFLNLNSARRTLRLGHLTQNKLRINSVRFVLKKSKLKNIRRADTAWGTAQKKLWKTSRSPESHRASSNLSRRRRTSRSLLNFHFTYRKRRPRSGSRAVNRRRRRLFRRGS